MSDQLLSELADLYASAERDINHGNVDQAGYFLKYHGIIKQLLDEEEIEVKQKRLPGTRQIYTDQMVKAFCGASGIPYPYMSNATYKKQFGALWSTPLWQIYDLFPKQENVPYDDANLERCKKLITLAVRKMNESNLTISSPKSILNVCIHYFSQYNLKKQKQQKKPKIGWGELV